ncbi:MAG: hypothetical protein OEM28_01510 [Nitrosopumilus sp.]|nr:hypothetical protein [Nitrosopumilus sp.]MDH3486544.1 hypothetical protein [Nitrosopumilus sp.]
MREIGGIQNYLFIKNFTNLWRMIIILGLALMLISHLVNSVGVMGSKCDAI